VSYVFDLDRLEQLAESHKAAFRSVQPYPHAVFDDFLRPESARAIADAFPRPGDPLSWEQFGAQGYEVKLGCADEARFPEPLRRAIHDLNSGPFLVFLETLTGIPHLLPDPYLIGGGIHLSRQGDHLGIHADFNWSERLRLHRRLNVLIYLTTDWQPGYGGELELWDTTGTRRERVIPPLFNRCAMFATRSDTFHGHPQPWAGPEGVYRQSIALYYYTAERPAEEQRAPHNTLYKGYNA